MFSINENVLLLVDIEEGKMVGSNVEFSAFTDSVNSEAFNMLFEGENVGVLTSSTVPVAFISCVNALKEEDELFLNVGKNVGDDVKETFIVGKDEEVGSKDGTLEKNREGALDKEIEGGDDGTLDERIVGP